MSTNYYYHYNRCKHCGREEVLKIGRTACGWVFLFNIGQPVQYNESYNLDTARRWAVFFANNFGKIIDENENEISVVDFLGMVDLTYKDTENAKGGSYKDADGYYFSNL